MHCARCGTPVSEHFRFCPECGEEHLPLRPVGATSASKQKWVWDPLTVAAVGITLALVVATALWLPARSQRAAGDPSDADMRRVFEHQQPDLQNGAADLLTFKRVSSESREILGVIVHFADYEAELAYRARGQTEMVTGRIAFKLTDDGWLGEDGQYY